MKNVFNETDQNVIKNWVEKTLEELKAGKFAGWDRVIRGYLKVSGSACSEYSVRIFYVCSNAWSPNGLEGSIFKTILQGKRRPKGMR